MVEPKDYSSCLEWNVIMFIPNWILLLAGLWLLVLSLSFLWAVGFFRRLTKGAKGEDLKKILELILTNQNQSSKRISDLDREVKQIVENDLLHIQRMGLIRFNPFKELGGEHSFSLAILNGKDTGFIITGLHTRDKTRMYVKSIINGKCDLELSGEEKKALIKAQQR